MNFFNPFDLLELDTPAIEAIKKAKKIKLAEIELDDGFLEWRTYKISKSDFIKLVDELDDDKRKEFYWVIKNDIKLNKFLTENDIIFFYLYEPRKVYNNNDFINFISPYFSERFNDLLLKAFKSNNINIVNKLFSVPILVNHEHRDMLYNNLTRLLNEKAEELQTSIFFEDKIKKDLSDIEDYIHFNINPSLLNALPDYFQKQRNDIANALRHISVDVWNDFEELDTAFNIIHYALSIRTDGATKVSLNDSLKQLNELKERISKDEKDKQIFQKWGNVFENINKIIEDIENKCISAIEIKNIIVKLKSFINVSEVNSLSDEYEEIKEQIALILRSISVSVFNNFEDAIVAMEIIRYAQLIHVDNKVSKSLANDYSQLQQIIENNQKREQRLNFRIDIRGDIIVINNNNVTYKNHSLITKEIDRIKFGVYVQTINYVRTSYYTIWYCDKLGNVIKIECNRLLNNTATVENQYRQILDASYNIVVPIILQKIENVFNQGKSIDIGNCTLNKDGVSYSTGSLFWKESHFAKWQDISCLSAQGCLYVTNKQNKQDIGSFSFRDVWNAVIFQTIKEYVIGIKG